jgi:hypothetical protein
VDCQRPCVIGRFWRIAAVLLSCLNFFEKQRIGVVVASVRVFFDVLTIVKLRA